MWPTFNVGTLPIEEIIKRKIETRQFNKNEKVKSTERSFYFQMKISQKLFI